MRGIYYTKYYRVLKHDTAITEISTNNFKVVKHKSFKRKLFSGKSVDVLCSIPSTVYSFPADGEMYYGYLTKADAMKRAKAGAQNYISKMVSEIEAGIKRLKQYRSDHYEDLNINLLDANIRRIEKEINIK